MNPVLPINAIRRLRRHAILTRQLSRQLAAVVEARAERYAERDGVRAEIRDLEAELADVRGTVTPRNADDARFADGYVPKLRAALAQKQQRLQLIEAEIADLTAQEAAGAAERGLVANFASAIAQAAGFDAGELDRGLNSARRGSPSGDSAALSAAVAGLSPEGAPKS